MLALLGILQPEQCPAYACTVKGCTRLEAITHPPRYRPKTVCARNIAILRRLLQLYDRLSCEAGEARVEMQIGRTQLL